MKKNFMLIVAMVVLITVLFFNLILNASAASSPRTIIGEVTLVGESMLKIKEDVTQMEYEFNTSPAKLKDINTGYRVEVKAANGKVSSLTILGMPMQAESEPYQEWKVIRYPER